MRSVGVGSVGLATGGGRVFFFNKAANDDFKLSFTQN